MVVSRHGRYRFQTGMITASLLQRGLPMAEAFTISNKLKDDIATLSEISSDQLGATDLTDYRKIIVPSDQPEALHAALVDHEAIIDAWLKDGWRMLELHLAAPDADAAIARLREALEWNRRGRQEQVALKER